MRGFWVLAVSSTIINCTNHYLAEWVPLYLKNVRGLDFVVDNIMTIANYSRASAGNILSGLFVRKLVTSGMSVVNAMRWTLVLSCSLLLSAVVAGLISSRFLVVGFQVHTGVGVAGFLVILATLMQGLDPAM